MRRWGLMLVVCILLPTGMALPPPQAFPDDDAGSGRDAPNAIPGALGIVSGVVYQANLSGLADPDDFYAFSATEGEPITVHVAGVFGCMSLLAPNASLQASHCATAEYETSALFVVASASGTWRLDYGSPNPQPYSFSLGVNQPAPPVLPANLDPFPVQGGRRIVAPASSEAGPHTVVAVIDSGVNPYHAFFRAPDLVDAPSTWIAGYPADAQPLALSLGASDYASALQADRPTFAGVPRSSYDPVADAFDSHLFYISGTRIVGAISFGEEAGSGGAPILDDVGHGTQTAALTLGADVADPDGNVLVVMVETSFLTVGDALRWVARQPWIDAVSVSIEFVADAPVTTSPIDRTGPEWGSLEAFQHGKPVFISAGNGASGTGALPDHCTTYTSPYTGPAWITRVGAADPTDGNPTWWHCLPVEITAHTQVLAPSATSMTDVQTFTGTSASSPNAQGHFAQLLQAARRAGIPVAPPEALGYLLHASRPVAFEPGVGRDPSLGPVATLDQGYGLADDAALAHAKERLLAGDPPDPRPETTTWFALDHAIRLKLWGPGSLTAGSG
jgi:hypothetical protein